MSWLNGFGISGYRSFGPEPQFIGPLSKINIFVGRNNVGKSNVLRAAKFVNNWLEDRRRAAALGSTDIHTGNRSAKNTVWLPVPQGVALHELARSILPSSAQNNLNFQTSIREILSALPQQHNGLGWYGYSPGNLSPISPTVADYPITRGRPGVVSYGPLTDSSWSHLWSALLQNSGGGLVDHHIPETLQRLGPLERAEVGSFSLIEAFRQIGPPGTEYSGLNGLGLIDRLQQLQSPAYANMADKKIFEKINGFVRTVTGCNDAKLEVPHNAQELLVEMHGRPRPIADQGREFTR